MTKEKKNKSRGIRGPSYYRAKNVYKDWQDNGFRSLKKAMLKNGYAMTTSNRPSELTKGKAWKQVIEEMLPDEVLMEKHQELLNARRTTVVNEKEFNEDTGLMETVPKIVDLGPDLTIVAKGLEMAYKIKGVYAKAEEPSDKPSNSTIYNLFYNPKIRTSVKQLENALKQQLYGEPLKDDDGTIPERFSPEAIPVEPVREDGDIDADGGDSGEDGGVEEEDGDDRR